ncbi:MAG: quinolinate synthase NadA [Candidatus Bathyarchaeota archaeon]|nr:quinolinate synthase NadA [Candidatus Bathyarchaeota archaeon]
MEETKELQLKIKELKEEKNAVLLVHNYQIPEIQGIADLIGDSLELCRKAQGVEADIIVFCGVDFMAETASILNPGKKVLLPNTRACCPMAAQLPVKTLLGIKKAHPGVPVVLYVNTLAEAKAECDVVCTSANAAPIVEKLGAKEVIFGPDWNLGYYVSKRVPDVKLIPAPAHGFCNTHRLLGKGEKAMELKRRHPDAELLVHPECEPELQDRADFVLSTGGMYKRCKESTAKTFIIATEIGMAERLRREIPGKTILPADSNLECPTMKRITLQNTYEALRDEKPVVKVPEDLRLRALKPIQRMLEMSK